MSDNDNESEKRLAKSKAREQKACDDPGAKERNPGSYLLVVIMLRILAGLAVIIILLPLIAMSLNFPNAQAAADYSAKLMEFSKWALAVLLGAFGAWIGAGAAYFFGKENLQESSRSTENAMRIQQEGFRPAQAERIKDMLLTTMNPNFVFDGATATKSTVVQKLDAMKGYWFVPVIDENGVLQDIVHARAFWDPGVPDDKLVKDIAAGMDGKPDTKKLHGDAFFVKVSPGDRIVDVYALLSKKDAEVVVVVDQSGKPTHCLSKSDISNCLRAAATRS